MGGLITIFLIFLICIVLFCFWPQRRAIILEGILIGVISGVLIAFITDSNFRASTIGPIKSWTNKTYSSNDWTDIKVIRQDKDLAEVEATNVISGDTVTFKHSALEKLPADLRWDVKTKNKLKLL